MPVVAGLSCNISLVITFTSSSRKGNADQGRSRLVPSTFFTRRMQILQFADLYFTTNLPFPLAPRLNR